MIKKLLIILLFMSQITWVLAQNDSNSYKFKKKKTLFGNRCDKYKVYLKKLPSDIRYSVTLEGGYIYFTFPSIEHFEKIFDKNSDGIAVDVLHKDQYQCGDAYVHKSTQPNKGYLLAPMFKREMEQNLAMDRLNNVIVEYGSLPKEFDPFEIELNLLILQKKALCDYDAFSNNQFSTWELLETGLYKDKNNKTQKNSDELVFEKTIEFDLPFEKNKSKFSAADIKSLYDSLDLIEYDINKITILAYTSVEGTFYQNEKLQKERAESMIEALQGYQHRAIKTDIYTRENWGQFAKDISGTKYKYLQRYTKDDLKTLLSENKELLDSLEPLLVRQRKGLIKLELQMKMATDETDPETIKRGFQGSLENENLDQALFIQRLIFDKINKKILPNEILNQLEIPHESEYGPLFLNIILFNWEKRNYVLHEAIEKLENLEKISPDNAELKYNLLSLKIEAWTEGNTEKINRNTIEDRIKGLKLTEIHPSLIERLEINYKLLLIQYLVYEKKFREKTKVVQEIYNHYKKGELSNEEVLSLANFLAFYGEFKTAENILHQRIQSETGSEGLLFFYLSLTLGDPKKVKSSEYKSLLETAFKQNPSRYCNLFLPKAQGGFTFQLMSNPVLKKSYCDNCTTTL